MPDESRSDSTKPPIAETARRLHSAAIHLLRALRRTDAELGIGPARLSALSVLVFGGSRSLGELAEVEQVKPPTMSRIVAGLEEAGMVSKAVDRRDRRATCIRATAKGRRGGVFVSLSYRRTIISYAGDCGVMNEHDGTSTQPEGVR